MREFGMAIGRYEWSLMEGCGDIDGKVALFNKSICKVYERSFPVVIRRTHINDKQWFNDRIGRMIDERQKAFRNGYVDEWKKYTVMVKDEVVKAKCKFKEKLMSNVSRYSGGYYSVIRELTGGRVHEEVCFPNMTHGESMKAMCEAFAKIANVFPPLDLQDMPTFLPDWPIREVNVFYVYNKLSEVYDHSAQGLDGIPSFLLKEFAIFLAEPIAHIINFSLRSCRCPVIWKSTRLVPIPKNANPKSPEEMRPLSIACVISKICERIIYDQLMEFVQDQLDPYQFGGLPCRSTSHYLIKMLDYTFKTIDVKAKAAVSHLLTDYTKAFDRVDHNYLIRKLVGMGVGGSIVLWISSFLSGRVQVIPGYDEFEEMVFSMANGTPQGMCLGGLLFILVVNDVARSCRNRWKFIDDLTCGGEDLGLQEMIDVVVRDSEECLMDFNVKKCKILRFSFDRDNDVQEVFINGCVIPYVSEAKLLGVTIQSNGSWDSHVGGMIKRANMRLYILYKLRSYGVDRQCLVNAYVVYIRPVLEYCVAVWHSGLNVGQRDDIEYVQKRVVKIIMGKCYRGYMAGLAELGLVTLASRRDEIFLRFAVKMYNSPVFRDWFPESRLDRSQRVTRGGGKIAVDFCRTARYKRTAIPAMIRAINKCM